MFSLAYKIMIPCNNTSYCGASTHKTKKVKLNQAVSIETTYKLTHLRKGN